MVISNYLAMVYQNLTICVPRPVSIQVLEEDHGNQRCPSTTTMVLEIKYWRVDISFRIFSFLFRYCYKKLFYVLFFARTFEVL